MRSGGRGGGSAADAMVAGSLGDAAIGKPPNRRNYHLASQEHEGVVAIAGLEGLPHLRELLRVLGRQAPDLSLCLC